MQALVPQDDEVELQLEVVAIAVLQVDRPLIVLALVVLFDASAYNASLRLAQQIVVLVACLVAVLEEYEVWFSIVLCSTFS